MDGGAQVSGWRFLPILILPGVVIGAWSLVLRLGLGDTVQAVVCLVVLALGIAVQRKILKGAKRDSLWRWWG
jgi:hypothetical protein